MSPLVPLTSRLHGVSLDSCGGVLDFIVQVLEAGGFAASMIFHVSCLGQQSLVLCLVRLFVYLSWWDIFSYQGLFTGLLFYWRLRLDSGHRSSKVCLSASIARSSFMDCKGYSEEESGKLLAPNQINLGKVVMTKEPGVAHTTWMCCNRGF